MKTTLFVFLLWLILVVINTVKADYNDVYSLYLERWFYMHEVDSGRLEYNAEVDKALWIDIQNACDNVWRNNLKHCWYNTLFNLGYEFTPYKGF